MRSRLAGNGGGKSPHAAFGGARTRAESPRRARSAPRAVLRMQRVSRNLREGLRLGAPPRPAFTEPRMFARHLVSAHQARLLEERARAMRFAPTRSEEWLWRRLSGSKTGFAFRRQLVIANFIVDFAATKVRLVVEVDGGYHEGRQPRDAARDRALNALGWRVLRVAESEVFGEIDRVVASLVDAAADS